MLPARLLELSRVDPAPREATDKLVRVAAAVDPETPRRFLLRGQGAPRWFFQQGETWLAGIGDAATLHLPPRAPGDRFEKTQRHARSIQEALLHEDENAGSPALVGGFSFHDDPSPAPPWDTFGKARFCLPALTLHHDAQGTRLVGTARVPSITSKDRALDHARTALEEALERLQQDPPTPSSYEIPQPADRLGKAPWTDSVEDALERIHEGPLRKAVLARTLTLTTPERPDAAVILGNLRHHHPGTNLFLIEPRPGSAYVGASPELVATAKGTRFHASAVAGSIPRGDDEDEDDQLARTLASSTKDREEHAIVVQAMRRRLATMADRVEVARDTNILRLRDIQHLERDIYARLAPDTHVIALVEELHPTPAVGGDPRHEALAFLREAEPFERGWYAGPVGWFTPDGDGSFAPGLRSAVLQDTTWHLFAGAGIVHDSRPDDEWDETRVKFQPILDALGAQRSRRRPP